MEWIIYTLITFSLLGSVSIYINRRRNREYLEINNVLYNSAGKSK